MLVAQSCPALDDPMDCRPPGSSVYGISQARILGCVAIPFSRGSSQLRGWTQVSHIAGRFFTIWAATREAPQYMWCGQKEKKKKQGLHFTPIRMPFFFYVGCAWSYFSCSMWNLELRHMNSQLQRVGSGSLTRDPTWIPCIGSREVLATEPPAKSLGPLF